MALLVTYMKAWSKQMGKKAKKIVSIDIELEDFEPIHLKMDEAKELYEQLHNLFGDKQKDVQHHYYPWYNQPQYWWYTDSSPKITLTNATNSNFDLIDCVSTTTVSSNATNMAVTYNTG